MQQVVLYFWYYSATILAILLNCFGYNYYQDQYQIIAVGLLQFWVEIYAKSSFIFMALLQNYALFWYYFSVIIQQYFGIISVSLKGIFFQCSAFSISIIGKIKASSMKGSFWSCVDRGCGWWSHFIQSSYSVFTRFMIGGKNRYAIIFLTWNFPQM